MLLLRLPLLLFCVSREFGTAATILLLIIDDDDAWLLYSFCQFLYSIFEITFFGISCLFIRGAALLYLIIN